MATVAPRDVNALTTKARSLLDEARSILENPEASAEDKGRVEGLMTEAKGLQATIRQVQELESLAGELKGGLPVQPSSQEPESDYDDIEFKPRGSHFKSLNGFLRAIILATPGRGTGVKISKNLVWHDDNEKAPGERKEMAESVGATGGFLVPPENLTNILSVMGENSIVRSRATKIRMTRRQIDVPVLDQTGTTAGRPHWFGGIQVYWTEEAGLKTESSPTFRKLSLVAHKMTAYTRVSDELLDDAVVSLTDFLMGPMGFPGVISWEEDFSFLRGSGAGQPLGILNAPATITINRAVQGQVTYPDLINMIEAFMPSGQGVWIMSQSTLSSLLQMTGPTGNPSYVWGPGPVGQTAIGSVPATLLGYPVIFTEKLPLMSSTSAGDVLLADLNYYLIGDRQATTLASTIYDRFQYDQTSFRAVHRVDGQPWLSAPITYEDGSTMISPFVMLGAKST